MDGPAPVPPYWTADKWEGWLKSSVRGLRNGIVCGFRIRQPYIIQSIAYAIIYRDKNLLNRVKFVLKQALSHGRNLGLFVFIYKAICWVCRRYGIHNGIDSWIAGFVGGFIAFGDSKGVSGSVNNQIVLYLFARGIEGAIRTFVKKGFISKTFDVNGGVGFRIFAGFSLALILYLTEYQPDMLKSGFMSTMTNLYHESNGGAMIPNELVRFSPAFALVGFSLIAGMFKPEWTLENLLAKIK